MRKMLLLLCALTLLSGCGVKVVENENHYNVAEQQPKAEEAKEYPIPKWLETVTDWKTDPRTADYFEEGGYFRFKDFLEVNGAKNVIFTSSGGPDEHGIMYSNIIFDRGDYRYALTSIVQKHDEEDEFGVPRFTLIPQLFVDDEDGVTYAPLGYLGFLKQQGALDEQVVRTYYDLTDARVITDVNNQFATSLEMLNNMFLVFFDERTDKKCPFDGLMDHYAVTSEAGVLLNADHEKIGEVPVLNEQ
ncbi:hypothetical protein IJH74_02090 [Candidatus Saccharibacteria bacterium]|nr:hypothetical protein [Candidatus Saccharibacteria bacterium]